MRKLAWTATLAALCLLTGCDASLKPKSLGGPVTIVKTTPAADGSQTGDESKADEPTKPDSAITLKTVNYEGILAAVARHKGKIVVVDAWATWCPPCVKEFHGLVELHKKHGPDKVACVSLSFNDGSVTDDPDDGEQAALPFLQDKGATFDNLIVADQDVAAEANMKLDFPSIPAILVYNRAGEIEQRFMEEAKAKPIYERVNELVEKLLADGEK